MAKNSSFINEFRKFIARGNVLDLAIGVVIGAAFGQITTSLVNDIIMPPLGLLLGGIDFSSMKVVLKAATEETAEVAIRYGLLVNAIINFLVISLAIFVFIRTMNKIQEKTKKEEEALEAQSPPKKSNEEVLLEEIRDILKEKK